MGNPNNPNQGQQQQNNPNQKPGQQQQQGNPSQKPGQQGGHHDQDRNKSGQFQPGQGSKQSDQNR